MRPSRTAVNRLLLGRGVMIALLGGYLLAVTFVAHRMPGRWPGTTAGHHALLDADRLARLRGEGWWTPSVMTAAIALSVLFGCWFLAQFPVGPARPLPLAAPDGTVRPQALGEALALRASAVPGVARSRAHVLPRSRRRLRVRLRVWLLPGTSPRSVLPALCAVIAEAEESATPYSARTRLRLSAVSHRVPHVR